jgi:hypothetical protein
MEVAMNKQHASLIILLMFPLITGNGIQTQNSWIETTQEDFKDGTFERNIYSSHRGGGSVEFSHRFDLNTDGYLDLFTSNSGNVTLYWGSSSGYSAGNNRVYPISSRGANNDAADINTDGYPDLIARQYLSDVTIFWGTPSGPDPSNLTNISASGGEAVYAADFNKDGYLDIATDLCQGSSGCVFWGSATGYNSSNRTELQNSVSGHNIEVGDLNRDGWLDIIFIRHPEYYIYWGSSTGFSNTNRSTLPALDQTGPHGLSIAELNGDEYLDIVTTAWYIDGSQIYWGSSSGYSAGNLQILNPGNSYGGSSIADMNKDGYIDIVYHRGGGGTNYQRIYWGSPTGYSDGNTSTGGLSYQTSGGTVADYNFDGDIDIFANGLGESYVSWGPSFTTNTTLPSSSDHHGMFREIGNVYNREYNESYISSVYDAGYVADWGNISWIDDLPLGSSIAVQVRSGDIATPDPSWSSWISVSNGDALPEILNAQFLQYKANLIFTNPSYLPILFEIEITYEEFEPCDPVEPPEQRTQGYWRRQCKDRPHEDICALVDSVQVLSDHFDGFDCIDVCDLMNVSPPENDMCRKAERQFMALLLNIASGKLSVCNCLLDGRRVEDVIGEIESLLESASPDHATCERAKTLADDINTGEALVDCGSRIIRERDVGDRDGLFFSVPNPFSKSTLIQYRVPAFEDRDPEKRKTGDQNSPVPVKLKIFEVTGRLVKVLVDSEQAAGSYEVRWDGIDKRGERAGNGIYFYRIQIGIGSSIQSGKMILFQ